MTKEQKLRWQAYRLALDWAEVVEGASAAEIMFEAERILGFLEGSNVLVGETPGNR